MEVSVLMMKRASESARPEARNFWRASSRESARTILAANRKSALAKKLLPQCDKRS